MGGVKLITKVVFTELYPNGCPEDEDYQPFGLYRQSSPTNPSDSLNSDCIQQANIGIISHRDSKSPTASSLSLSPQSTDFYKEEDTSTESNTSPLIERSVEKSTLSASETKQMVESITDDFSSLLNENDSDRLDNNIPAPAKIKNEETTSNPKSINRPSTSLLRLSLSTPIKYDECHNPQSSSLSDLNGRAKSNQTHRRKSCLLSRLVTSPSPSPPTPLSEIHSANRSSSESDLTTIQTSNEFDSHHLKPSCDDLTSSCFSLTSSLPSINSSFNYSAQPLSGNSFNSIAGSQSFTKLHQSTVDSSDDDYEEIEDCPSNTTTSSSDPRRLKDRSTFQRAAIPFNYDEVVNCSNERFKKLRESTSLTSEQISVILDARRRATNRYAAERCRRMKVSVRNDLVGRLARLRQKRELLIKAINKARQRKLKAKNRFAVRQSQVLQMLYDRNGDPLSSSCWRLHFTEDNTLVAIAVGSS